MNNNLGFEFTLSMIVLFEYIIGKVWIYYKIDKDEKQK